MKKLFIVFLLTALALPLMADRPKIIVERNMGTPDTVVMPTDTSARRMVIDPGEIVFQMKADSINQAAEEQVRALIKRLERKFDNPEVEDEVGRLIGEVVMQQQMALLDLQIDRAISLRDTLLLKGLEVALQELLLNNDVVLREIRKQLQSLERQTRPEK